MFFMMLFLLLIFTLGVFWVAQKIVQKSARRKKIEFDKVQAGYKQNLKKQEKIVKQVRALEAESNEIFMLYDMTKEIAKNFNEEAAQAVFVNKLKDTVSYDECQLLGPLSEGIKQLKKDEQWFLVRLKGHRKILGYLAVKGVAQEEQEKVLILANQFALALERIRLYQEVERMAITDSLTEVHTRRYILERFEEELKRSYIRKIPLSFLMVDVDYFKHFNDQYGHLTGDKILREISSVIRETIREIDSAGRYGGEEFCIVLPDTDREGAYYVAQRIREAVEKTMIKAYDATVRATVSVGVSTFPDDGKIPAELIDKADWALYRAKKMGRNTICAFGVYED
ncbi:MAG: sensor domain-containing diguanylate cyclase [Candidatus Omnitrophica bacterium]|nr:sensor domain-containing diguanylate cyclase [Candidatus Omnitrophota bacterium]